MRTGLSYLCILFGSFMFIRYRLLRYLRYFQQEEYSSIRFIQWFLQNYAFDKKGSLIAASAAVSTQITGYYFFFTAISAAILCIIALLEENPQKQGKLRLNMTERATRIYYLSLTLYGVFSVIFTYICPTLSLAWLVQLFLIQLTPCWLIASNRLLDPGEKKRQQIFVDEARGIFENARPFVIGITGSYGKTSTKDALSQILQITLSPTFWPEKGINTFMGITRTIRTGLQEGHRFAVIEMGAYGRGSIQKLCRLTPPQAAIITMIGTAHLERFGSQENIFLAKSELAQALPLDGILVCNGDDDGAREIANRHQKKTTLLYGYDNKCGHLDCWISSWSIKPKGTAFTFEWRGQKYEGFTPLFGKQALSNAMGAFTMACALGSDPNYALAVIRQLQPVDNRLQVKKDKEITFVHDAYNSNPIGFAAALQVLADLPGNRRIVVTPGMIELGNKQKEENERIGTLMAKFCDLAILVGETNKGAIMSGLHQAGFNSDQIIFCATRNKALDLLKDLQRDGDIILIENDLPDLYEQPPSF